MSLINEPSTIDKLKSVASDIGQNVSDGFTKAKENVTQGLDTIKTNMNDKVNEFSSNSTVVAASNFLDMNTTIAKFAFLILVVVAFLILFNLGMQLIGYIFSASPNPYIVNGQISASDPITILQDPTSKNAGDKKYIITIPRSNNAVTGIEFTWCLWIKYTINTNIETNSTYLNIFNKGDLDLVKSSVIGIPLNNGPGVFFGPSTAKESINSLWVLMDTMPTPSSSMVDPDIPNTTEYIEITNIPINKYFHLAIRCENKFIDVYINGTVVSHTNLVNVPKQNFYDIKIGDTKFGPDSYISNFRYFSTALSVIDINSIVTNGPNTKNAFAETSIFPQYSPNYLSNLWYQSKITNP
jgi:hypothetical protein